MCVLDDIRMLAVIQGIEVKHRTLPPLNMADGTRLFFRDIQYVLIQETVKTYFTWSQQVTNGMVHDEVMLGKITLARLNEVVAAAGGVVSIHEGN